jgi:hypothetical protein
MLLTDIDRINQAFHDLRGMGYIAHRDQRGFAFSDECMSKMSHASKGKVRGTMFYDLYSPSFTHGLIRPGCSVAISWGLVLNDGESHGAPTEQIKKDLLNALENHGLIYTMRQDVYDPLIYVTGSWSKSW